MSASTSLVKQLLSEQSKSNSQSTTGQDEAAASLSYDDVKAAAKEGTAEALSEHGETSQEDETEPNLDTPDDQSTGGRSLKRVLLLVLIVAYYLQRRRGRGQSTDTQ
jgi:hypothetical protein